jgi:hypothetical protein
MLHGPSAMKFLNDSDISIDEFILNHSLVHVLADPLPQVYHDIIKFIDEVSNFTCLDKFAMILFFDFISLFY